MTHHSNNRTSRPGKPLNMKRPRYAKIVGVIAIFAILASLAIVRSGHLFGYDIVPADDKSIARTETRGEETVINTTGLASSTPGYAGEVPVEITVSDGRIVSVTPLPNEETPSFFARTEALTRVWDGLTLSEAAGLHPDAVSGATYSSRALIANVEAGINYALDNREAVSGGWGVKAVIVLLAILLGGIVPLFTHNRIYRFMQQLLNVAVLGFWAGTFIDYAMMINFFANGLHFAVASITACLLLVVGLVYPLFGKASHYCLWICPYGSLQDLAGKCSRYKLALSPKTVKSLDTFRRILWTVLMTLLFAGWGAEWIDYEIFTAFIVESASWAVISVGVIFVGLSVFVSRPFCRFVCPTGSLLKEI